MMWIITAASHDHLDMSITFSIQVVAIIIITGNITTNNGTRSVTVPFQVIVTLCTWLHSSLYAFRQLDRGKY